MSASTIGTVSASASPARGGGTGWHRHFGFGEHSRMTHRQPMYSGPSFSHSSSPLHADLPDEPPALGSPAAPAPDSDASEPLCPAVASMPSLDMPRPASGETV